MNFVPISEWLRKRLWICWPVGAIAWCVWAGSLIYGGWTTGRPVDAEGTPVGVDHLAFYSAGRLVRDGRPELMYDHEFLGTYQGQLLGWDWRMLEAYRNPPFYALLYYPAAGFTYVTSLVIWTVIGIVALCAAASWLRPFEPARVIGLSLTFYPVFAAVSFGQNSLLSLGVFAGTYRLLNVGKTFTGGLLAGLLWYKPQLLLGFLLWWGFAPRRYARCLAGLAVTGALLAAVCWLLLPGASWAFVDTLGSNAAYGGERGWNKQSPRDFWSLLLPDAGPEVVWALTAVCAIPVVIGVWWVARRTDSNLPTMFAVSVFASLWLSPHTLVYEWTILIAAGVVLWEQMPTARPVWVCLYTTTWLALAVSTPLTKLQIDFGSPVVVQIAVPVMAIVAVFCFRELGAVRPSPDLGKG